VWLNELLSIIGFASVRVETFSSYP